MNTIERMKVVLLAPYFRPDNYGGAVQVYENLFRNQEFDVHIICPSTSKYMSDDEYFNDTKLKIHRLPSLSLTFKSSSITSKLKDFLLYKIRCKREIVRKLNIIKPDIIINGGIRKFAWLTKAMQSTAPVINYIHGEELSIRPVGLFGKWLYTTQNQSLSKVKVNICVSSYTANAVLKISPTSKVKILTNFVDSDRYQPPINKDTLKKKLNLENVTSLICVCRLIKRKGVEDLLLAIKEIVKVNKHKLVLNICGAGPELDNLKQLSRGLGLSKRVMFHGFTEDKMMLNLLQASDIFVMPNKTVDGDLEGFGLVFLEANACGLPVIGGRSGGVVDAIENNVSGFLVDPESPSELIEKLTLLIENEDLRLDMGKRGLLRAISDFSLVNKRAEFNDVLLSVKSGEPVA